MTVTRKHKIKLTLFSAALTIYVLSATSALLAWHIFLAGGQHHHDSEHCPICQNIVANASKAFVPVQSNTTKVTENFCEFKYIYTQPNSVTTPQQISPRAPPA